MSKWLRISNPGNFDVESAVWMLGASVKEHDNPIGLFGSGTKYALAQAARQNIDVKISTDGKVYSSGVSNKTFRNRDFASVVLKTDTGATIQTPMTTAFGKEDWTETWFIFREFFSNAIDEGSRQVDIVNGVKPLDGHTCVFLPFDAFAEIYENLEKYFTTNKAVLWVGDGSMFRRGVFVGQLQGINLNFQSDYIRINECRKMDNYSAFDRLGDAINVSTNKDVWVEYLKSTDEAKGNLGCNITIGKHCNDNILNAVEVALIEVYGDNYCLCPKVDDIIKDLESSGYNPVLNDRDAFHNARLRDFKSLDTGNSLRAPNEFQQKMIDRGMKAISDLLPSNFTCTFKVISQSAARVLGQADLVSRTIYLLDELFTGKYEEFVRVLIHECGHIVSGVGDYDRAFTDFFVKNLARLCV